ncbi:diguanylate cyclase (GGDEF)-like protein [Bradyrhizobium diazoefficiens]|uniref:GGDEF-domain containing protein n=1 Tax=Bradyrhizobium diazoefficiens TaxID=1355477 RepID=A0A810AVF6_9BRAD|nr:EAL domain-containing protein [Bradyrhizobium diazoefficiens]WLA54540.1 EAL domain-containing protein [Bradyrhizobium diazoefficiens]BBZ97028.1 GGDEF-domain containing protein [Bradyrhizobium diazoefficiens]BCA14717.1 GGDEF-domain containing protein [Bradyrhizobium diazoefficiens]BCE59126.1 GGDEF-domain containing protein [Bradyrhizobium diazoefficiens]BCE67807.1 GGDEF-domain containing protein [Bradyrhizobium diazoefficiens]
MPVANLKSHFAAAMRLFRVPADNPDLTRAQFDAFSKQVPLLYFILMSNTIAVAYTYVNVAPDWLTMIVPSVLTVLAALRTFWWLRQRHLVRSDADILRNLRATNWMTLPIGAGFTIWSFALYPYGDPFAKSQVAFYMAVTVIGCIFSLMHLRSAALIVTLVVDVPYVLFFWATGEPTLKAIAVNNLLVSGAMVTVLFIYYRDFADLVASRKSLLAQQAATQALSDENFRLANLDSLTELPNRRRFFAELSSAFTDAERRNVRVAVGIIDLDGFKPINDNYGHSVGDRVLIEAGRRIREVCEGFGPQRVEFARLGGDEFGLVVCGDPEEADLTRLGERIGDQVKLPYQLDTAHTGLSCSIGFALFPQSATTAEALYECADYSLYHAKRHLRGRTVIFSSELEAEIRSRGVIENLLRTADFSTEMDLVFQPILDAMSEHTTGFEVLARWHSSRLGLVSPADFIPAAERIGLIRPLTQALLIRALATARTWPDHIRLSFNLSAHDICSPEGILPLITIVEKSGLPPHRIDFEITETAVTFDFVRAQQSIAALKAMGCGISLDDFGTGYSSLSHVHRLPLDKIKVDRSFVADINDNPVSHKIIKSLTGLCDDMEIACVVEGVETRAQLDSLRRLGCDFIQGYYFAKPMRGDAIGEYLAKERQRLDGAEAKVVA